MARRMSRVTWRKAKSREPRSLCMEALTSGARASGPGVSRRGLRDSIGDSLGTVLPCSGPAHRLALLILVLLPVPPAAKEHAGTARSDAVNVGAQSVVCRQATM